MAKVNRKQVATYINTTPTSTASYLRLGADLEELTTELNNEVEETVNILGEASVTINNGNPVTTVEPYMFNVGDGLAEYLQDIIDTRKEGDDLITDIVQVKLYESPTGDAYPAVKYPVKTNVTSYGGDTTGYQIPFDLHHYGTPVAGTYDITANTFTAS